MIPKQKYLLAAALLLLTFFPAHAQTPITGKVVDEENRPLAGVFVSVREGTQGEIATTNSEGNFTLNVRDKANAIVDFSLLGFEKAETRISGNTVFIKMKESAMRLDDAVVVAYGSVSRKDLTGAVAEADIDEMNKVPVPSFSQALAGRIAGVSVSASDGQPGSEMKIVIRGNNSITKDNSPLYIVDGFPMEDLQTASINPEDIKTFNVLKDASATALYGARGANGVIVIETKGGFDEQPVINFSTSLGVASVANRMEMMSPYEFVKYQTEIYPATAPSSYFSDGRTLDWYKTAEGIDWQDQIFRNVFVQNYNLSIRGGNANTKYTVSGSVFLQPGVILNTGSNKYQLRSVLEQKINKKLSMTLNLNGSYIDNYGQLVSSGDGGTTSSYLLYRTWAFRPVAGRSDINLIEDLTDPENVSSADIRLNPLITSRNDNTHNSNKSIVGNFGLRYSIIKGLQLRLTGTLRYNQEKRKVFYNSKTTQGSSLNPTNTLGVNGLIRYSDSFTWNTEAVLNYEKVFRRTHRVGAMIGTSLQDRKFEQFGYTGYKIDDYEGLGMAALDNGLIRSAVATMAEFSLASFFGRFNYGYKSRYLLTATLRADGSSKFPNHKWGVFPSAALAWNISEESFMKKVSWISNAKLRLSYGVTGNNRVGDYDSWPSLTVPIDASYSFGNGEPVRGLVPGAMGNANLKWESTYQWDLGMDFSMFDDRISVILDLYKKDTRDLLLLTDAPRTTGYPSIMKNVGSVRNTGIELTLNTVNVRTRSFEWSSNFNIAFNRNKVVELDNDTQQMFTTVSFYSAYKGSPLYLAQVGMPMGLFYGYVFDGVYQFEDFDNPAPGKYVLKLGVPSNSTMADRNNIHPGDIRYRDLNGDGQVDDRDMTVIGNGNPIHTGGFTNTFRYKNIDFSFLLQWSYGNDIYNANRLLFEGNAMKSKDINQYASYNRRWTPDNPSDTYYRSGGEGPAGRHSSRVIEDGSYLRLKSLSLGYSFPRSWLSKVRIKELRASFSANNILTLTGYTGMDPEVSTRGNSPLTPGFDYSAYPIAKTFMFGIQLTF